MPSNTCESGFETFIVNHLVTQNGYEQGVSADYNREYAVDVPPVPIADKYSTYINAKKPDGFQSVWLLKIMELLHGF
jgi:hypothetical protein